MDEVFALEPTSALSDMADKIAQQLRTNVERLGARLSENLAGTSSLSLSLTLPLHD